MFDTQKYISINNSITYVVPKNKTMSHIMSLTSRIYCVMGIYIFWFEKYWHIVFDFINLDMGPTFKKLFQDKKIKLNKNISYYQQYDVKITRSLHKQEISKKNIYKNVLARQTLMDFSPGFFLEAHQHGHRKINHHKK